MVPTGSQIFQGFQLGQRRQEGGGPNGYVSNVAHRILSRRTLLKNIFGSKRSTEVPKPPTLNQYIAYSNSTVRKWNYILRFEKYKLSLSMG